jgi:hypothetical protein
MAVQMSDEQYTSVERWVHAKMTRGCPYCAGREWNISNEITIIPSVDPNTPGVFPDFGLAFVLVTCANCAATVHFSAPDMGILE